jgi:hypothetical protein
MGFPKARNGKVKTDSGCSFVLPWSWKTPRIARPQVPVIFTHDFGDVSNKETSADVFIQR